MVVTDSGKLEEHNLYATYSSDDVTTWANTWTGDRAGRGDPYLPR